MSLHPIICRVECPYDDCDAEADIIDRWTWRSTDGPIEHWALMCVEGHHYVGPVQR